MSDNKKYFLIDTRPGATTSVRIDDKILTVHVTQTAPTDPGLYISAGDKDQNLADVVLYRRTPTGWLSDGHGEWLPAVNLPEDLIPLEVAK